MADMTEADKNHIRIIWKKIFVDSEGTGRIVLLRLFKDHPETKNYFKNFKNISTQEEMEKSAQIERHGKVVMTKLNEIMQKLDDWNAVCGILTTMAERHDRLHKVEAKNFKIIFQVIIKILEESLGTTFTPEIRESWLKLFSTLYNYLDNCYKNLAAAS